MEAENVTMFQLAKTGDLAVKHASGSFVFEGTQLNHFDSHNLV